MAQDGDIDLAAVGRYPQAARSDEGFADWLRAEVFTVSPDAARLALLRGPVAEQIADLYPAFAQKVFGTRQPG